LPTIACLSNIYSNGEYISWVRLRVMVFKATFNNISVILWWLVLLVEETRLHGENH
jgi:hypothetical protein